MVASLAMYHRAELEGPQRRLWDALRAALLERAIDAPEALTQEGDPMVVWNDPTLVLSQTCGMPYRRHLRGRVQLVGTLDYGLEGCDAGFYRSAFVVRRDDPRPDLRAFKDALFAFNQTGSQSGFAAPYQHVAALGFWFERRLGTGAHRESALAVAEARADIAALDAVSWRLMQAHDDFAQALRVLEWTVQTPGLPLITGPKHDPRVIYGAVEAALEVLSDEDRSALGVRGLVRIDEAAYLAVPNPPDSATGN